MHNLPEYQTNHPFFRKIKPEMTEKGLILKEKLDNYHNLHQKEKMNVFLTLMENNIRWPDYFRQEGFWCEKEKKDFLFKEFPFPKENEMPEAELEDFLKKLSAKEKKLKLQHYMGYSKCRLCDKLNGTGTYHNDLFAWPQGYKHYIEEHKVQPSAAFVLHIRGLIQ